MEVSGIEHVLAKHLALGGDIFLSCERIHYGQKEVLSSDCSQYNRNFRLVI